MIACCDRSSTGILPIGQQMWYKHLMTFKEFPPLQAPETFNLEMILKAVQAANAKGS